MCHVCPIDFVCKERKIIIIIITIIIIIIIIIIILTKTIVFTIVMVKPNNVIVRDNHEASPKYS